MPKPQSQREIFAKTQPDVLMRKFEAKAKESRTAESDLTTQGRLREAQRMGSQAGMYEQRAEKWRAKAAIVNPLSLIPPPTPPPPPAPIPPIPTTSSLEAEQAAEDIRKQQGRRRGSYRSLLAGETGGFRPTATPRGSLLGGG